MNYDTLRITKDRMDVIKPLWEKLNAVHSAESPYFGHHFETLTFSKRMHKFDTVDEDDILIEIVKRDDVPCGYCITTVIHDIGELESLFVDEEERGNGLGRILAHRSIEWMKERKCREIKVSVSYGHESVFGFYQKMGFYPRLTYLQLKEG